MSFKSIALRINKDQTTISKEVKRHIKVHINSYVKREESCPLLAKAPFVCNGCPKKRSYACQYRRQLYEAKYADEIYRTQLVDARTGIALDKESFYETDRLLTEAVGKGQHIYHVVKVIMTLHFTSSNFMVGILLDNKTAGEAFGTCPVPADEVIQSSKLLRNLR